MKMGSDITPTLLLAGTLIVSSTLLMGTAQASDTTVITQTATDTA